MTVAAVTGYRLGTVRPALLFGNFAIGAGVMVVAGTLNDLARSLQVSVSIAGQLIAVGGLVVAVSAPLLAGWVAGFDRRRLLTLALAVYAAGHLLCALMPSYAALWPVRALTMLGAAVFTPQAAAAIGFMAPPEERGRSITFIFVGWSVASVVGLPIGAWLGETFGWQSAFLAIAALAAIAAAWVHAVMPNGVRPAALSAAAWKQVATEPLLLAIVGVTALQSIGQYTLFAYLAPYYKQVLHASAGQISLLFCWFGIFGLIGNLLLSRYIDRLGAHRAVTIVLSSMALGLLLWPLAVSFVMTALALVPWGLGSFAASSSQQARLSIAAPALAPALLALNTSAIYLGTAAGASSGGFLLAHHGFGAISWFGFQAMLIAIVASLWIGRRPVLRHG